MTSKSNEDLQRKIDKVTAETARLDLRLLLKKKQRILKHKRELLEGLTLLELHAQENPQGHPNNAAPGRTWPQSNTSTAEIPMARKLAQRRAKEPKIIREKSEKELHEWI